MPSQFLNRINNDMPNSSNQQVGDDAIINCHAHIFTIDHVPNNFAKTFITPPFDRVLSISNIKWVYNNLTPRGSKRIRRISHKFDRIKFVILDLIKSTIITKAIYKIVVKLITWVTSPLLSFLNISRLLSPEFKDLLYRYLTLARYSSRYKTQKKIYEYLTKNYPDNTKHVILSMDMDYMEAGEAAIPYIKQLEDLKKLSIKKSELLPFIFADPRRISETSHLKGKSNYLNQLKSDLSKNYFSGIKLYPALGYYPFDPNLIELYQFANDNSIPLMTHCIHGSVYFRGKKKKEWNFHEILTYNKKGGNHVPIPLPQKDNKDFTRNFTHPLNYECLLNAELLSSYLGYDCDLSELKICLAHFGGSPEWNRYRKDAWNGYNNIISPSSRDDYLNRRFKNTLTHGSKRTIWWNASWLSIIYDLMIKYDNVYSDVSFMLHNEDLFPLLNYLLLDEKVNDRILFGTDYYVVSPKGLDKELYQGIRHGLGEELFHKIAVYNPRNYLRSEFNQQV